MCTGRENDNWIIFELDDDDEEDDYDYDDDDRSTSVIRAERRLRGERWREARFTPADIEVVAPTFHVNHISTHARTRSRTLFVYPVTALMNSKIEPLRVTHPSSSPPLPSPLLHRHRTEISLGATIVGWFSLIYRRILKNSRETFPPPVEEWNESTGIPRPPFGFSLEFKARRDPSGWNSRQSSTRYPDFYIYKVVSGGGGRKFPLLFRIFFQYRGESLSGPGSNRL